MLMLALTRRQTAASPQSPKLIHAVAMLLWQRLFVELGLFAQSNNRPGWLTPGDAALFEQTVEGLFGDDCRPVALLTEAGVLRAVANGDLFCEWFARCNPHLAGDHKTAAEKGNLNSAIVRRQKQIHADVMAQGSLLAPEIYRTRAGEPMERPEQERCLVLIANLDRTLGTRPRRAGDYSEGLLADAHAVITAHDAEALKKFYGWLAANHTKPLIPQTAEQILRDWERVYGASLQSKT